METLFLFDIIFSFFQEYLDEELYSVVRELRLIAKHYMLGSFIFDFMAWVPFDLVITVDEDYEKARLLRLLKLLRIPRLV